MTKTFADFADYLREHPELVVVEITLHPADLATIRHWVPEHIGGVGEEWRGLRVYSDAWVPRGHVRFEASKVPDIASIAETLRKVLPSR